MFLDFALCVLKDGTGGKRNWQQSLVFRTAVTPLLNPLAQSRRARAAFKNRGHTELHRTSHLPGKHLQNRWPSVRTHRWGKDHLTIDIRNTVGADEIKMPILHYQPPNPTFSSTNIRILIETNVYA